MLGSFGLLAVVAQAASISSVPSSVWISDGPVSSVLQAGELVYVGGLFTSIGPYTGSGAPIGLTSGSPVARFPEVDGSVETAVSDGHGGFYVGGSFTEVGGVARTNLAHVEANGSVDPVWNPHATTPGVVCCATVLALARSGSTVYAGGSFRSVGGRARSYIAALDARTGRATAWNPNASAPVSALVVSARPCTLAAISARSAGGRVVTSPRWTRGPAARPRGTLMPALR